MVFSVHENHTAQSNLYISLGKKTDSAEQAFVQACFVLVDTADEDAMAKAEMGDGAPLERQVPKFRVHGFHGGV